MTAQNSQDNTALVAIQRILLKYRYDFFPEKIKNRVFPPEHYLNVAERTQEKIAQSREERKWYKLSRINPSSLEADFTITLTSLSLLGDFLAFRADNSKEHYSLASISLVFLYLGLKAYREYKDKQIIRNYERQARNLASLMSSPSN
jgi:hypothetical protein